LGENYIFQVYMQEYGKHRDEILNCLSLQNGFVQRGINLTVLTSILLATSFSYLAKDFNIIAGHVSFKKRYTLFLNISIPTITVYGTLVLLLIQTHFSL